MSFWKGFAQAWRESDERKHEKELFEEARKYKRDDFLFEMREKRKAEMEALIAQRALASGGSTSGGGGGGSGGGSSEAADPQLYIQALQQEFGIEESALIKVMESENPLAPKQLYDAINSKYKSYTDDWGGDEAAKERFKTDVVGNAVSSLIIGAPKDVPVFNDQFLGLIDGMELDPSITGLLGTTVRQPGGMIVPEVANPQHYDPAELGQMTEQLGQRLETIAIDEKEQINNRIQQITVAIERGDVSAEERTQMEQERAQLIQANSQVDEALEALKRGSITRLEQLFGDVGRGEQEQYYPNLDLAPGR